METSPRGLKDSEMEDPLLKNKKQPQIHPSPLQPQMSQMSQFGQFRSLDPNLGQYSITVNTNVSLYYIY